MQVGQAWAALQALRMRERGPHGAAVRAPTPPRRNPVLIPAARYHNYGGDRLGSCH